MSHFKMAHGSNAFNNHSGCYYKAAYMSLATGFFSWS
jgi:hypothetical protein